MNQATSLTDRAEAVRQRTLAALRTLIEKGKTFSLPAPAPGLEQVRQKLEENTYQVLVVGEAKRGKSTFVNALIGRDILPTDVDVATSQVFRICPASREAYRLCFEDNSKQSITLSDLPRYGSQVAADTDGVPRLDQIIRWIEVDAPAQFLPRNVHVLDTPGLGALYAAHAEITHRFVPHADAIIFVLDSQAPIGEPEIRFLEKLLGVTNHLFFIQTKIDQFRKDAWQQIQQRNEDILRQRFKERLPDARVWPISSTNLRKAAQTNDPDYLMVSRHKELAAALQGFLFRVAGWSRSARAVVLAEHEHSQSRNVLTTRLDGLMAESQQKRVEVQQRAAERRKQFDAEWGEGSQKRRELLAGVQKTIAVGKQSIRQALQIGGTIESQQQDRIENLTTIEAINQFGQALPGDAADAAWHAWGLVRENTQSRCTEMLIPFLGAMEDLNGNSPGNDGRLDVQARFDLQGQDSWWTKTRTAQSYSVIAGLVANYWAGLLLAPAVAIPAALFVGLWAWNRGWRSAEKTQLKSAKQELAKHLTNVMRQIQRHFFDVDHASNRLSIVDEYFNSLDRCLSDQIAKLAAQKLTEAQTEIERLTQTANLDDQQRKAKAEVARRQLAEWDDIGRSIKAIQADLTGLNRSVQTSST